jgi:hypothetical protein
METLHSARVAFEGSTVFVAAANSRAFEWLSEMFRTYLGVMYELQLAETRLRLQLDEVSYPESAAWRARLEELLDGRPDLVPVVRQLVEQTSERLTR